MLSWMIPRHLKSSLLVEVERSYLSLLDCFLSLTFSPSPQMVCCARFRSHDCRLVGVHFLSLHRSRPQFLFRFICTHFCSIRPSELPHNPLLIMMIREYNFNKSIPLCFFFCILAWMEFHFVYVLNALPLLLHHPGHLFCGAKLLVINANDGNDTRDILKYKQVSGEKRERESGGTFKNSSYPSYNACRYSTVMPDSHPRFLNIRIKG